jgi:DNA-binding MarR family transcriptional regulator
MAAAAKRFGLDIKQYQLLDALRNSFNTIRLISSLYDLLGLHPMNLSRLKTMLAAAKQKNLITASAVPRKAWNGSQPIIYSLTPMGHAMAAAIDAYGETLRSQQPDVLETGPSYQKHLDVTSRNRLKVNAAGGGRKLSKRDRELLAQLAAEGAKPVPKKRTAKPSQPIAWQPGV